MKMIIGGAFQGKLAYAKALYPDILWIDGRECSFAAIESCAGINHFQEYIRRMMKEEKEARLLALVERLPQINAGIVIISEEVGYGLVPVDSFERKFREQAGRICTRLAACCDRVDRVICGIGTVIKAEACNTLAREGNNAYED